MTTSTQHTDKRRVIVTGGAGGIGRAIVGRFLDDGARVAVVDLDTSGLARWRDTDRVLPFTGDVADPELATATVGAK
jgi:NAD(P)-dependent dehydrogenase (short-subunit alcohol dehydrogenase family)